MSPLRVWQVVEGKKKTADGKTLHFSIQEIPEDRYEEAVDLMCDVFIKDETICAHFDILNNTEAIADLRKLWNFVVQQGISVGAFLVDENNPKPILAGVNMTYVKCKASEESINHELTSQFAQMICKWFGELENEVNIPKLYKIEKYMSAFGLCVNRSYRSQGLAFHLLKARDKMCAAYNIQGSVTTFTGWMSQKSATNAGFETHLTRNYSDVRDEEGHEQFSGIPEKVVKVMGKRHLPSQ